VSTLRPEKTSKKPSATGEGTHQRWLDSDESDNDSEGRKPTDIYNLGCSCKKAKSQQITAKMTEASAAGGEAIIEDNKVKKDGLVYFEDWTGVLHKRFTPWDCNKDTLSEDHTRPDLPKRSRTQV